MVERPRGERIPLEPFDCAPALRLESHEQMVRLQFQMVERRLHKIEEMIERLERRLWLTVYGVVGMILAQALQRILETAP